MWMTAEGPVVLQGAQATLIRTALGFVVDLVDGQVDRGPVPWQFSVPPFDNLERAAQLVLLVRIGDALLSDRPAAPRPTELNDATVAALYAAVRQGIESEIDDDELFGGGMTVAGPAARGLSWRQLVLAAGGEARLEDLPSFDSPDVDQWHLLVDALATPLLWGAEGEPIEGFAVGGWPAAIGDDYFHDVPPRGDERQLQAARARLQQLLQSPGDAGGAG